MRRTVISRDKEITPFAALELLERPLGGLVATSKTTSIVAVDLSEANRKNLRAALEGFEHELIHSRTTPETIEALAGQRVDLVLIDLATFGWGGLELCRLIKKSSATQFLPVYVLGTDDDMEQEVQALEAGADEFLTKPLRPRAFRARVQASLRTRAMIDSLDDSETVLFSLAQSVEERDPDLGQHCHRLALMGAAMGLTLGLPSDDILALQRGGYLHDIGKVAVPDRVLFKPGPLTAEEWDTMKTHAQRGERICGGMRSLKSVLPIIRNHHERWDGSGYPDGLQGEEIPLLARILQIADIYDALTTVRPYKAAVSPEQALATIREEAKRGWRDPNLVEMFGDILPTFRTTPIETDHSHFSLHALAISVERFRTEPGRRVRKVGSAESLQEFRLASGF
jgi:putative two-component system response regulator